MAGNGSRLAAVIEKELKAKHIQMKKELQEYINELKEQQEKAYQSYLRYRHADIPLSAAHSKGAYHAFSGVIQKLTLLLNSESENSGKNDADNGGKPM